MRSKRQIACADYGAMPLKVTAISCIFVAITVVEPNGHQQQQFSNFGTSGVDLVVGWLAMAGGFVIILYCLSCPPFVFAYNDDRLAGPVSSCWWHQPGAAWLLTYAIYEWLIETLCPYIRCIHICIFIWARFELIMSDDRILKCDWPTSLPSSQMLS